MCVVSRKAIARVDWVVATASTLREKEHKHLATSIAQGASNPYPHIVILFYKFLWEIEMIPYDTYWHYRNLQKPALMSRSWQQLRPTWADSLSTLRDQVQLLWMSCTRQPTPWRSIWRRCRSVARKDLTYWAARNHSKTLHQTWRGHPVVSFGGLSNRKRCKQNLKTWGETLQNLHPPMMWAHIDWVGRVVRSVASSKVAMMMWLWQHSHAWKHGTREVTFTLTFEDVWLSPEHRTSLFWKQVSKFFTLCFHENSLRQPKVLPFRSALFRPRSFFSSQKPRAVTRGRHSGGAGWIGGPWWQDSIYTCRPRHSCFFCLLLKWMMPWCFQGFGKGPFFHS